MEVRIGKYGPGLFAKNDIEPKTSLITLRLVFKFKVALLLVSQSQCKRLFENLFWNEDQITIEKAFEVFEGVDMSLDDTMDGIDLLALYLAIESKFISQPIMSS